MGKPSCEFQHLLLPCTSDKQGLPSRDLHLLVMPLQVLHDAFFKNQTKPPLSQMGQLYYEGKEYEAHVSVDVLP